MNELENQWWTVEKTGRSTDEESGKELSLFTPEDERDVARLIHNVVASIEQRPVLSEAKFKAFASAYLNRNCTQAEFGNVFWSSDTAFDQNMTYNVCKMCVDSIASKIAMNKVRPEIITSGGSPDKQEKAAMMTSYMDYLYKKLKVDEKMELQFRDKCIYGTSCVKASIVDDEIVLDNVRIRDLRFDAMECMDGDPSQLHQVRFVSRATLRALYPDMKSEIASAPSLNASNGTEHLKVIESWHLRSGKKAKDGLRVVSLENACLEIEPYDFDRFPFVFGFWTKPLFGFHGVGLVEELLGIQHEINETLDRIRESMRFSVPRVFINSMTDINEDELNDIVGAIVRYDGQLSPVVSTPSTVSDATLAFLKSLFEKAFETSGISLLSATSKKPGGLESGAAISEYMDIETERFSLIALAWEREHLDLADLLFMMSKALYGNRNIAIKIMTEDKRYLETKFWKEISFPDEDMELSLYPTPPLPKTPAGQIQAVINLTQGGVLQPEEAKTLLRFKDTNSWFKTATAKDRFCRKLIGDILVSGEIKRAPNDYMPLDQLTEVALEMYLDALTNESIEETSIAALEEFMEELKAMQAPPPAPANDNGMAPPQGAPMPPTDPGIPPGPPPDQAPLMPVSTVSSPGLPPPQAA